MSVYTSRHIYMDLDLPRHVYENETIGFKLTINADKLDKDLSVGVMSDKTSSSFLARSMYPRI